MSTKNPISKINSKKSYFICKYYLIENIAKSNGLPKTKSEEIVNSVFDFITSSLQKGKTFQLIGFGAFKVVNRAARNGRNPSTGKAIKIPASKSARFSVGKKLKDAVNGGK